MSTSQWIYLMQPPRQDFMATLTAQERAVLDEHLAWLRGLDSKGSLLLAGPCLGPINTGVVVFEAVDDQAAHAVIADEPLSREGYMHGDLRPYRVDFMRR